MSDAADVVQEVFISVMRGIGDFERQKSAGSFRSWLATITRNRTADYFRRVAKTQSAAGGSDAMMALEQLAEAVDATITLENIQGALTRQLLTQVQVEFETNTWTAFWLTTMEGKSASEVAATIGLSRASVYQAKSRVLSRLRQRLCVIDDPN